MKWRVMSVVADVLSMASSAGRLCARAHGASEISPEGNGGMDTPGVRAPAVAKAQAGAGRGARRQEVREKNAKGRGCRRAQESAASVQTWRSPAWSVACERAARRSVAVALAVVAVEGLANNGGTIGSGFKTVKTNPTALA